MFVSTYTLCKIRAKQPFPQEPGWVISPWTATPGGGFPLPTRESSPEGPNAN